MILPKEKTKKVYEFTKMNALIYGPPKIGKTTFASKINGGNGVLFLATESGHKHVEVNKLDIGSWDDFINALKALKTETHDYHYLIIDVVDWLWKMCEDHIAKENKVKHYTDLAYGKGSTLVKDQFIKVINYLNHQGFGLCFISHAKEREQKTKTESWTYMDTSLPPSASQVIAGFCDFIFYAYIDKDGKVKMRTKGHKYINSGDRTGVLPDVMDFSYEAVQNCLSESSGTKN